MVSMNDGVAVISVSVFFLVAVFSLYVLYSFIETKPYTKLVKQRFVHGIPWGTVTVSVGLVLFYIGVQGGHTDAGPVTVGYRSWSFVFPEALLFSSFAHYDAHHLIGNVTWFVVFGTIAEFLWGHYPQTGFNRLTGRSDRVRVRVLRLMRCPRNRIIMFVVAVVAFGVASSFVTPGASLGASGIVFAICGVVIVLTPKLAILGLVVVEPVRVLVEAVVSPVYTTTGHSVAGGLDVSFTSHVFGLCVGVFIAYFVRHRLRADGERVSPGHIAVALFAFAVMTNLYAFTQPVSSDTALVLHAIGVAFVLVLVVLSVLLSIDERIVVLKSVDLSAREIAVGSFICIILAFSVIGVVYNVVPVTPGESQGSVEVNEYTVMYGEEVDDAYSTAFSTASVVDPPKQSGVIVTSDKRNVWHVAVTPSELRANQEVSVPVGGIGWREDVSVQWSEWRIAGQQPVYSVTADQNGETTVLYDSTAVTAPHRVDGNSIQIGSDDGEFTVTVQSERGMVETVSVPDRGESVSVNGITIERQSGVLYAGSGDTSVRVATHRSPE